MSDNKDPGDRLLSALTTITPALRATRKDPRKKALSILLAIFLVSGGIIFTVSIYKGLGDLRDMDKGSFTYDFSVRSAALPLFQYFSVGDENEAKPVKARARLASVLPFQPRPDISDWMAKGGTGAASAGPGIPSAPTASKNFAANPARNTPIPQMAARTMGLGSGGGASQSSAGAPKSSGAAGQPVAGMSKSQVSGEVTISESQKSAPVSAPAGSKLVGALASTKGAMMKSMQSESAATARTEWNQAFGADAGTAGRGTSKEMAYAGGSGLTKLDGIKGGIGDLKTSDIRSLKAVTPPSPTKDKASEKNDSFLNAMKGLGGAGSAEQGKENAKEASKQTGKQNAKDPETGADITEVPPEVYEKVYKPVSEGGLFCGSGQCETTKGKIVDKEARVTPVGDGVNYKVEYIGTQSDFKGTTVDYTDTMILNSQTGTYAPAGSEANCNGGPKQKVEQGGSPPGCPIEK
jgi:hypothetical protein